MSKGGKRKGSGRKAPALGMRKTYWMDWDNIEALEIYVTPHRLGCRFVNDAVRHYMARLLSSKPPGADMESHLIKTIERHVT